jgi:hypothetical protein
MSTPDWGDGNFYQVQFIGCQAKKNIRNYLLAGAGC